jgi:hypothetical protein
MSTPVTVSKDEIGEKAFDIATLIGLLDQNGDLQTDWFSSPVTQLESAPGRAKALIQTIQSFLCPRAETNVPVFTGAEWYEIRNPSTGNATGFYVVTPPAADAGGLVGLGVQQAIAVGNLSIDFYVFIPVFRINNGREPDFVLIDTTNPGKVSPVRVGFDVSSTVPLDAGNGGTFTDFKVEGDISLDGKASDLFALTIAFTGGTMNDGDSYHSLTNFINASTTGDRMATLIVQGMSYWLNLYIGDSEHTVGDVLVNANLLGTGTSGDFTYYSYDANALRKIKADPLRAAEDILFGVLEVLADNETPLIPLPFLDPKAQGGDAGPSQTSYRDDAGPDGDGSDAPAAGVWIAFNPTDAGGSNNHGAYGLRIMVPDIPISLGKGPKAPTLHLCLGTWFSGETSTSNWVTQITNTSGVPLQPGLSVFLLRCDTSNKEPILSFVPSFELRSVGVNIEGGGDAPLINLDGYTLQGAELRANLSSTDWSYGFATRLDKVGFPLGAKFDSANQPTPGSNSVAQNLLASSSQQGAPGETSAVNPGFSAEAGFIKGFPPRLMIYDPQGTPTDLIWFPVQKRFGPINCSQIGLKIDTNGEHRSDPILGIEFDGGVALGALDIELDQLSVDVHLKKVADLSGYSLDLQGLAVNFNTATVQLSGGLYKTEHSYKGTSYIAYDGEAVLRFKDRALSALGTYASIPGGLGTSLFIFATLNAPLGGPPFFYVTGLAAGFGYNRALKIPSQSEVQSFPLVAGVADQSVLGGSNPRPQDVLAKLEDWVPPERGEYWLAAGVQFTTFEIIKSNVLLIVEFGHDFVVSLLGISTLKQPATGTTYAYAELDLEVVFDPGKGLIQASGVLAPSSYVLTPEAHLTGGFAFYAWFGEQASAGDFVFTIGGYHPAFDPGDRYPQVPRVGLNWQVESIAIMGDAYFAITPTAIMVGGGLSVTYDGGRLKAWLKAQADAIAFWKPFYLMAEASVSVGVSYRLEFLSVDTTLSVEIGADFKIWGPPTGGSVHVDWCIISFTIPFGKDLVQPNSLTWQEFKGLLPAKPVKNPAPLNRLAAVRGETNNKDSSIPAYLTISGAGLKSTITLQDGPVWIVQPGQFQFHAVSAIPASSINIQIQDRATSIKGQPVALRSVHGGISQQEYQSIQTVTIRPEGTSKGIDLNGWNIDAVVHPLPQAMWGDPVPPDKNPDINPAKPTVDGTVGVTAYPKAPDPTPTPVMVIESVFVPITIQGPGFVLPILPNQQPAGKPPEQKKSFDDIAEVNSLTVAGNRAALFEALLQLGINGWTNNALPQMAANPRDDFPDEPLEVFSSSNPIS